MSFHKEIINELERNNVGTFGDNLFLGSSPSIDSEHLTVYNTGGPTPEKDQTKVLTFQFITKAEKYVDAEELMKKADEVVRERYNFFLGPYRVLLMEAQGEFGHIGTDDNDKHLFSSNYSAWVRKLNY
jgi:hypothetical protein